MHMLLTLNVVSYTFNRGKRCVNSEAERKRLNASFVETEVKETKGANADIKTESAEDVVAHLAGQVSSQ